MGIHRKPRTHSGMEDKLSQLGKGPFQNTSTGLRFGGGMPFLPLLLTMLVRPPDTGLAAQSLPQRDIVLFNVQDGAQDRPSLSGPLRVTDRAAYDNQPAFSPDGSMLYYTAGVAFAGGEQTDIRRYRLADGDTATVLHSPESEYSPRVMPDGEYLSVVRVELPDSAQRIWRLRPDGRKQRPVMSGVEPVGYYTWLPDAQVACFILGEAGRHTLQVGHSGKQRLDVVAARIGRCLQTTREGKLAYVDLERNAIRVFDPLARTGEDLAPTLQPEGPHDFVLDDRGRIWMGAKGRLYIFDPAGDRRWHFACEALKLLPEDWNLGAFDRMALAPDGSRLALVFERLDSTAK